MSIRTIVALMAAVCFGLMAMLVVSAKLQGSPDTELVGVVAAKRDLFLDKIGKEDIERKEVPESALPAGYIRWPKEPDDDASAEEKAEYEKQMKEMHDQVLDKATRLSRAKGEILVDRWLADATDSGLLIPDGMRAVSIHFSNASAAVNGFVLPGSRVDVLATPNNSGGSAGRRQRAGRILENVEVLAVDQRAHVKPDEDPRTDPQKLKAVTVLLKPDDVEQLEYHKAHAAISLALRGGQDSQVQGERTVFREKRLLLVRHVASESVVDSLRSVLEVYDDGGTIEVPHTGLLVAKATEEALAAVEQALQRLDRAEDVVEEPAPVVSIDLPIRILRNNHWQTVAVRSGLPVPEASSASDQVAAAAEQDR